jgi:cytochrome b6-f complex iron-sulfur subunit
VIFTDVNRKQFIKESSYSIAAICLSCVACTKEKGMADEPTATNRVLFNINLNTQLLAIGDSLLSNNVLLVRLSAGNTPSSFTAVQRDCTHAGGFLTWDKTKERFWCPVHGSEFSAAGIVLLGPAINPLKVYKVVIENNSLTVTG